MNTTTYMPDLTEVLEGTGFVECDRDGVPLLVKGQGFANPFTQINNLALGNEGEPGLIAHLNGAELKLYFIISRFTIGYQNRRYWQASHETVAEMTGIGRKAMMRAAKSLSADDKKLISHSRVRGVTMWRVHPENIPAFLLKMSQNDSLQLEAERVKMTQSMSQNDSTDESKGLNQRVKMTRPSKKESINKVERKKEKDSAPKNGAPQVAEISADLPEPPTAAHEVTPVEITDIQAVVQTAPPVAKIPPKPRTETQVVNDEMFKFMAIACGWFTPAIETADGKDNYHGKATRIGKELKELKLLNVTLSDLEQMTEWLKGQWKYQDGRHINLADYRAELNNFRDHQKALVAITDPAKAEAIQVIKAVCVTPVGGWETVAQRLNKAADWFIERGEVGKIAGFKAYWAEFASSAPDLDNLAKNWIKFTENNGGKQHANNAKNRGRATTPLPTPAATGLGGSSRKVTFAEFIGGSQARV
jgi:hypothetical protein